MISEGYKTLICDALRGVAPTSLTLVHSSGTQLSTNQTGMPVGVGVEGGGGWHRAHYHKRVTSHRKEELDLYRILYSDSGCDSG